MPIDAFKTLLDIVKVACEGAPISEHQFHTLLAHVKQYATCRATRADEHHALLHAGYPGTYDLCAHIDTLRFAFYFGEKDNEDVQEKLNLFATSMAPQVPSHTVWQTLNTINELRGISS